MGVPAEVVAARMLEHAVVVPRRTTIFLASQQDDTWISGDHLLDDLDRAVSRCVVGDDQLEVGERLVEHAANRLLHVALTVEDRQADRDPRHQIDHSENSSPLNSRIAVHLGLKILGDPGSVARTPLRLLDRCRDKATQVLPHLATTDRIIPEHQAETVRPHLAPAVVNLAADQRMDERRIDANEVEHLGDGRLWVSRQRFVRQDSDLTRVVVGQVLLQLSPVATRLDFETAFQIGQRRGEVATPTAFADRMDPL